MYKIGITGNMGSGKTTICRIFEHLGVPVYYSDQEAKKFYACQNIKDELYRLFGAEIFTQTGGIDAKKMAKIVFNNAELLQKLNTLIHPLVWEDFEKWCKNYEKHPYVLLESAIIYPCKLTHLFDKIIFVDAPLPLILERVRQRDKINFEEIKKRIELQSTKFELMQPNYIIQNNEKQLIIPQVIAMHQDLISFSSD